MTCNDCYFKGESRFGKSQVMNTIEINLKSWFDWAFLQIGAFTNVAINHDSGLYGGNFTRLSKIYDPIYSENQVYESCKKDWVWENDTEFENIQYIEPVVYVNDVEVFNYNINYPLGRVIFDSALTSSDIVKAEYTYRQVQTYIADQTDWWNELQFRSFRVDDSFFTNTENGNWAIGSEQRIQMPCIIIEATSNGGAKSSGFQLGDGSMMVRQGVNCYVLAEKRHDRNRIMDILRRQFDKTLQLFDVEDVAENDAFPLNYLGDIENASNTFCYLSTNYPGLKCRFISTDLVEMVNVNPRLFSGIVRMTCELILPD